MNQEERELMNRNLKLIQEKFKATGQFIVLILLWLTVLTIIK